MRSDRADSIRAFATIRFMGGILQPSYISSLLSIQPTICYVEGERYIAGPDNEEQTRKTSLWMLDTEKHINSLLLEDHMLFAKRALAGRHGHGKAHPQIDQLSDLLKKQGARLDVGLFWFGYTGTAEPKVDDGLQTVIEKLGGRIELDFYIEGDSKESELMIA